MYNFRMVTIYYDTNGIKIEIDSDSVIKCVNFVIMFNDDSMLVT